MRRWLTTKEAAEYCRYSVKTFKKYAREYKIPRYGPKNNRYLIEDLDKFMHNPRAFIESACLKLDYRTRLRLIQSGIPMPLDRKKGEFIPV